jgi:hypothetical protein
LNVKPSMGYKILRHLDKEPICFKGFLGHKEALKTVPGWQDKFRAYAEHLIEEAASEKSLYPDKKSYEYTKKQADLFNTYFPEIAKSYAGQYILFENGKVIDSDFDEDALLDRVWDSDFVKERKAIFIKKV